jgi:hypothetical protein
MAILKESNCNLKLQRFDTANSKQQTANSFHSPLTTMPRTHHAQSDDTNLSFSEQLDLSPRACVMSAHNLTACLYDGGGGCFLQSR